MKIQTWDEIVKMYPDRYVGLINITFNGAEIASAEVVDSCIDKEIGDHDEVLYAKGINASWFRTKELEGGALWLND